MVRVLSVMLLLMLSMGLQAEELTGWYWYEDNAEEEHNLQQPETPKQPITKEEAQHQLEVLQQEVEATKALAVMNPSVENIANYIKLQNELSERSTKFAHVWKRTLQIHPELDYRHVNPTNQIARRVYYQNQREMTENSVKDFTEKYGLLFFFRSDCPYCHRFAPILKRFEEKHGIEIMPISLDGPGLPEYPNPKHDNGIANNLEITTVPAVMAVDPKTNEIIPVSYGLVATEELVSRIHLIQSGSEFE